MRYAHPDVLGETGRPAIGVCGGSLRVRAAIPYELVRGRRRACRPGHHGECAEAGAGPGAEAVYALHGGARVYRPAARGARGRAGAPAMMSIRRTPITLSLEVPRFVWVRDGAVYL